MKLLCVLCASQTKAMSKFTTNVLDIVLKSKSDNAIRALGLCILSEDSTFIAKNESKINEFLKLLSSRQENFRDLIVILAVRESWGKTFLKCNEMMRVLKTNTSWSGLALDALGIEVAEVSHVS